MLCSTIVFLLTLMLLFFLLLLSVAITRLLLLRLWLKSHPVARSKMTSRSILCRVLVMLLMLLDPALPPRLPRLGYRQLLSLLWT